jgi:hypothetical protein
MKSNLNFLILLIILLKFVFAIKPIIPTSYSAFIRQESTNNPIKLFYNHVIFKNGTGSKQLIHDRYNKTFEFQECLKEGIHLYKNDSFNVYNF